MATDRVILQGVQTSQLSTTSGFSADTAKAAEILKTHRRSYSFALSDNGYALGQTLEYAVFMPVRGFIRAVQIIAPIAVTGSDTDYCTFTLSKRTAAGNAVSLATYATSASPANSLVAFVPVGGVLTSTLSNLYVAANDVLTASALKTANGVIVASAGAFVTINVVVEEC